jgi:two-component system, NtrC family, response regulator AtoC
MATILVVDDEEPIRLLLSRFLKRAGHAVVLASNGTEALAAASVTDAPDVILTDLTLKSEPSGLVLVRELKALRPDCPVIVATGHGTQEVQDECAKAGASQVLTKPFDLMAVQRLLLGLIQPKQGG